MPACLFHGLNDPVKVNETLSLPCEQKLKKNLFFPLRVCHIKSAWFQHLCGKQAKEQLGLGLVSLIGLCVFLSCEKGMVSGHPAFSFQLSNEHQGSVW